MKDTFQKLQDQTLTVSGIIWFTKTPLAEKPLPFLPLDYLVDGIITKFVHRRANASEAELESNLFFSKAFGKNFFIAHIFSGAEQLNKHISSTMDLLDKYTKDKKKILVIEQFSDDCYQSLRSKYSSFEFNKFQFD
ncbi:MAG: hypothetical protein ISR65_09790 [Bacteriovoracaceae bacterium]|nr:hypothetical protein [Bacteriovoracaceae bacterium]